MTNTIPAETITLEQLRDLFELELVEERTFFSEWQANLPELTEQDGNPQLLAEIPPALRSQESNLEVSERLRQLSTALKKARMQDTYSGSIF